MFFSLDRETVRVAEAEQYYRDSLSTQGVYVGVEDDARLAFAREMARRTPLFALAGVDLEALKASVDKLDEIAGAYALKQSSSRDRDDVRNALYPTRALRALLEAESVRRTFIAEPTRGHERFYYAQLERALDQYAGDLERYSNAFERIEDEDIAVLSATGVTTKKNVRVYLVALKEAATTARIEMMRRSRCADQQHEHCRTSDLQLPELPKYEKTAAVSTSALTKEILDIRTRAGFGTSVGPIVRLEKSSCLAALPAPYDFIVQERSGSETSIRYVGDMLFLPASQTSPHAETMSSYLAEKGASYIFYDPMSFYVCPSLADDTARVVSIAGIAAANGNTALHIEESSALGSLAQRLREEAEREDILSVALMYANRSAGFHHVVAQVTGVLERELEMIEAGLPVDGSAKRLFRTQSGFPDIFLGSNRSVISEQFPREEVDLSLLMDQLTPWSRIRNSVAATRIIADLSLFLKAHSDPRALEED